MKSIAFLACIPLTLLAATDAWSQSPSHSFIEASFSTGELDLGVSGLGSVDIDQDGFKVEGSLRAADRIVVRASWATLSGDEGPLDLDFDTLIIGAAWLFPVRDNTHLEVGLEYRTDDLQVSAFGDSESDDVDGAGLTAGVRSLVSNRLELFARASYLGSDYDGAVALDAAATFFVTPRFGITAGLEYLDVDDEGVSLKLTQFQLGGRITF